MIAAISSILYTAVLSLFDIKSKRLPLVLCIGFLLDGIVCMLIEKVEITALIPGAVLCIISFLSRGSLGIGDGIATIAVGMHIGLEKTIYAICLGFLFSSICGAILFVIKKNGKYEMPFIPFICVGLVVSIIVGGIS